MRHLPLLFVPGLMLLNAANAAALASSAQTPGYGRPWRIPITFIIDRRGVLRFDGFKFAKALDLHTLEKIVAPLLREPRGGAPAQAVLGRKNTVAGQHG